MNLLFDLDGTLADPLSAFRASIHHAFAAHGMALPGDDLLRRCIGPPLHVSLEKILGVSAARMPVVLESYRRHHGGEAIYQYEFYEGAEETLKELQGSHRLFVATSKPIALAGPLLRHFEFAPYFSALYGSELDGERSNKADLIRYLLEREGLRVEETVMIGDREHDVIGAKANGLRSLGVLWGYGSAEELKSAGADQLCGDWAELRRAL